MAILVIVITRTLQVIKVVWSVCGQMLWADATECGQVDKGALDACHRQFDEW